MKLSKSRSDRRWLVGLLFLTAFVLFGSFVFPQGVGAQVGVTPSPSVDDVNAIAKKIYCPVCENTTLDVCMTKVCAQWRDLIHQKLEDGWTEEEILDYFVAQYGDHVLVEPPRSGFFSLVYILPAASIGIALVVFILSWRSMRRPKSASPVDEEKPSVGEGYLDRFEEEISNRDQDN